jgi:hypothetical protein
MAARDHTLPAVTRALTIALAAAVAASGMLTTLHVHGYGAHRHAEHRHGPAAHGHVGEAAADSHDAARPHDPAVARIEPCRPGAHVVPVAGSGVSTGLQHAPAADRAGVLHVGLPTAARSRVAAPDARAHSPPRLTDGPLRAPPLSRRA